MNNLIRKVLPGEMRNSNSIEDINRLAVYDPEQATKDYFNLTKDKYDELEEY